MHGQLLWQCFQIADGDSDELQGEFPRLEAGTVAGACVQTGAWLELLRKSGEFGQRRGISLSPSLSLFLCPPEKKAFCICFRLRQLIKHFDVPLPTRSSCFYNLDMLLHRTPKISPIPWYLVAITRGNIWVMGGTESVWTGSPPIDSTVPALISQLKDSSNISLPYRRHAVSNYFIFVGYFGKNVLRIAGTLTSGLTLGWSSVLLCCVVLATLEIQGIFRGFDRENSQ